MPPTPGGLRPRGLGGGPGEAIPGHPWPLPVWGLSPGLDATGRFRSKLRSIPTHLPAVLRKEHNDPSSNLSLNEGGIASN